MSLSVLAPVSAGQTYVDMTLTFNSNRDNELIWAETQDANGNIGYAPVDVSGALAKAQVNLAGLQDYGCDAAFANLDTVCGDGVTPRMMPMPRALVSNSTLTSPRVIVPKAIRHVV